MKSWALTALSGAALTLPTLAGEIILAERGKDAECAIVISERASPSQRYAAEELRDFTEKTTGVRLPIVTDAGELPAKAVLLGETRHSAALLADSETVGSLGPDGFRIVARPPHLLVVGSPVRGTLYGAYELLERFAGCRWYSSWHYVIPEIDRFAVPDHIDDTQRPAIATREPGWWDVTRSPAFAARIRADAGGTREIDEKFGGNPSRFSSLLPRSHTFQFLLPPKVYFDSHPEYFALVKGVRKRGKDGAESPQLCLTNPDVLRIVASNVLDRIRQDPSARYYGVGQNDNPDYCECPSCKAVDDEEGSHAGTMVRFLNAVGEAVEKEFPDAILETLAYSYTRKPPTKTRLRHNVVPCLCASGCEVARAINESPYQSNIDFLKDVEGWSRQADGLNIWTYVTDFLNYTMPFANVYSLQGDMKFFRDHHAMTVFTQGAGRNLERHADFAELKAWLTAKWMWNPDLPMKPLLDDFFAGYYGRGVPFAREYFEALHRIQRDYSASPTHPLKILMDVNDPPLTDEFLAWASGKWRQAEEAVQDDPATSYNVRMGSFSVDYTRLERMRPRVHKILCFMPEFAEKAGYEEARRLANSLLARMDEAKGIRLSEDIYRHRAQIQQWRELAAEPPPVGGCTTGEVTAASGKLGILYDNRFNWGELAADPAATGGKALKLFNTHSQWCVQYPLRKIAFEPGSAYRLRVRVRVEKAAQSGEAFRMGILVHGKWGGPLTVPRHLSVSMDKTSSGYAWYELWTWVPGEGDVFWIAPPRLVGGKSPVNALWVDKIELTPAASSPKLTAETTPPIDTGRQMYYYNGTK